MNQATPGGRRLRALRHYYGMTQLNVELEASLGTGYLQRVETGRVQQPARETVERILAALGARYNEKQAVLERFGYVVAAPIPTADDIEWAIDQCRADIMPAHFPVYLLDCSHRLLMWNDAAPLLWGHQPISRPTPNNFPSMLKLVFEANAPFGKRITNPRQFLPAQIRALRYERQWFHGEAWYNNLIKEMSTIPPFKTYWDATEPLPPPLAARPLTLLELSWKPEQKLQFRLVSEPFVNDRRFRVIYCLPANAATNMACMSALREQ